MSTPEVQNFVTAHAYEDCTRSGTVPFSAGWRGRGRRRNEEAERMRTEGAGSS